MFANRVIGGVKVPCVALYIVCVIVIILYGYFLRKTKTQDVLAKRIYHHPVCQEIDGWSVSHFLFFGLLGLLFPGHHLQFLLVGIFWEIVETALGQNNIEVSGKRLQLIGEQDEEGNSTGKSDAYWYGKESDIVMDIVGYCLGSAIAGRYWPNECENRAALPPSATAPPPPATAPPSPATAPPP
ncbi:MAG: hypothetical protein DYH06_16465, partial [Acidobacteria bacterium ACB2]|nr:hypothetical protein [Acidobacteria bacterium ACB2]